MRFEIAPHLEQAAEAPVDWSDMKISVSVTFVSTMAKPGNKGGIQLEVSIPAL
jgi:hypothetical protein